MSSPVARHIRVVRSDRLPEIERLRLELHAKVPPPRRKPKARPATRQRGKEGSLREQVYERDERRCVECGSKDELTLDHRIPKSKGGPHTFENLQTMCQPCNNKKGDKMPEAA